MNSETSKPWWVSTGPPTSDTPKFEVPKTEAKTEVPKTETKDESNFFQNPTFSKPHLGGPKQKKYWNLLDETPIH